MYGTMPVPVPPVWAPHGGAVQAPIRLSMPLPPQPPAGGGSFPVPAPGTLPPGTLPPPPLTPPSTTADLFSFMRQVAVAAAENTAAAIFGSIAWGAHLHEGQGFCQKGDVDILVPGVSAHSLEQFSIRVNDLVETTWRSLYSSVLPPALVWKTCMLGPIHVFKGSIHKLHVVDLVLAPSAAVENSVECEVILPAFARLRRRMLVRVLTLEELMQRSWDVLSGTSRYATLPVPNPAENLTHAVTALARLYQVEVLTSCGSTPALRPVPVINMDLNCQVSGCAHGL